MNRSFDSWWRLLSKTWNRIKSGNVMYMFLSNTLTDMYITCHFRYRLATLWKVKRVYTRLTARKCYLDFCIFFKSFICAQWSTFLIEKRALYHQFIIDTFSHYQPYRLLLVFSIRCSIRFYEKNGQGLLPFVMWGNWDCIWRHQTWSDLTQCRHSLMSS